MAPRLALADAARKNVASIAQLVERNLAKVEVTSSNLVTRSNILSLAGWQNGYAADCKSVDLGSTPGPASKLTQVSPGW